MTALTLVRPLAEPVVFKSNTTIDLAPSTGARMAGVVVIVLVLGLYLLFSPLGVAR